MKNTITKFTVKAIAVAAFSAMFVNTGSAQAPHHEEKHCGSTEACNALYAKYPGLQAEAELKHQQSWVEGKQNLENNRDFTPPLYIIPVVFHIIHNYGGENISDAQILDQMMILNRDYRKNNADTSVIVAPFGPIAADTKIEFRLAQLDPDGNCTNGIERIASMETYVGDDGSKLNQWPRDKYLNVWVVQDIASGAAGYAYYPGSVDGFLYPYDGILILSTYVGSIGTGNVGTSRALTHEVGHWLSIPHVWGSTNSPGVACGDEGIMDTPETMGWTICPSAQASKVCDTAVVENFQNYMDYSYCSRMFTWGQADAMHYALNSSSGDRNNLWSAPNLAATGCLNVQPVCLPHADFDVNRNMICEGGSVTFTDLSHTSTATAWQWTLTGPTTLTSTAQNPTFSNMNATGWYTVQLIATNATGTDTMTKANYLLVSPDQSPLTPLYSEGFEDPNFLSFGYAITDMYGNGSIFHRTTNTAYTGTACLALNTFGVSVQGDSDIFVTPSYDLRFNTGMQLSFKYAYATAATSADLNTQTFKVWSSNDCGVTWTPRWSVVNSNVVTAGYVPGFYIPQGQADWQTVSISLPSSLSSQANVRFKFTYGAPEDGVGNNLYIDDINIFSTNVGISESTGNAAFSVYPNPGNGNSTIAYTLTEQASVKCDIFDLSGRLVSSVDHGDQAAGNYTMPVSDETAPLAAGTYMIQMTIGDKVSTRKYVVASQE